MTAVMTSGPLATLIVQYLAHREALRKTSRNDRHTLRLLDRYLGQRRIKTLVLIDGALIDAFLGLPTPSPSAGIQHAARRDRSLLPLAGPPRVSGPITWPGAPASAR